MDEASKARRANDSEPEDRGSAARSILHVDMDAFYAAVEVLDNPALRGLPVIVGGTREGHGVVSTASYEARAFGVRSAMPAAEAVRRCPGGVFLRPRMGRYADISRAVFEILLEYTPLVEPLSIDEAFLDVTGCAPRRPRGARGPAAGRSGGIGAREPDRLADLAVAEAIAREIQERIRAETGGLTCSIGVAENKFLAKVASDLQKPNGLVVVPRGRAEEFLAPLPVERLWGVGPKTSAALRQVGLDTIGRIARLERAGLERICGVELARRLNALANGLDDRPVEPHGEAKSLSQETTFARFLPVLETESIARVLFELADGVAFRLRQEGLWGRTVKLKVRDDRFHTVTRAATLRAPTQLVEEIYGTVWKLYRERVRVGAGRSIRLLGVGLTGLTREAVRQLEIFDPDPTANDRAAHRARVADRIREKLGDRAVTWARLVEPPRRQE